MPRSEVAAPLAQGPLSFLPNALLEPRRPLVAMAAGWLSALIPSLVLAALVAALLPEAQSPQFDVDGLVAIFLLVIFAPVAETLLMGGALLILLRLVSPGAAVILSALGWGLVHSLAVPAWGLVIWWPFLIFSTLFVTWRSRSLTAAFAMPAAVHALHNLPPALLIATGYVG